MLMYFDKEEWKIKVSYSVEEYGSLSNLVNVHTDTDSFDVAVAIPAALFFFMRSVLRIHPNEKYRLFLEFCDGGWVFGLMSDVDHTKFYDLWVYKELPVWADKRFCVS